VVRRKAEVVAAVRRGLLSLEQACSRYALSAEEYLSWQNSTPPAFHDSQRMSESAIRGNYRLAWKKDLPGPLSRAFFAESTSNLAD
jgi:Protein of unknown function (DUF1153)